jgi:hypothetical protein
MDKQEIIKIIKEDSDFGELKNMFDEPNIFKVTNMCFTETWHSSFWSWLFDPQGSHGFKTEPLSLLFKTINEDACFPDSTLIFTQPNEKGLSEKICQKKGYKKCEFDTFININYKRTVIIEYKIKAQIEKEQIKRYIDVMESDKDCIFIYVVPITQKEVLLKTYNELEDNYKKWHCLTFQDLYENILCPLFDKHKNDCCPYDNSKMVLISDYMKNLRCNRGGIRIAYTQEEQEKADSFFNKRKQQLNELQEIYENEIICKPREQRTAFFDNDDDEALFSYISGILFYLEHKTPQFNKPYFKLAYQIDFEGKTITGNDYKEVFIKLIEQIVEEGLMEKLLDNNGRLFYENSAIPAITKSQDDKKGKGYYTEIKPYFINTHYGIGEFNKVIDKIIEKFNIIWPKKHSLSRTLWPN